jgi:hypothetical protein
MHSLASVFRKIPLLRSLFGGKPRSRRKTKDSVAAPAPSAAPSVIVRTEPTLFGNGLLRSFGYGQQKTFALKDVSLQLQQGELNL